MHSVFGAGGVTQETLSGHVDSVIAVATSVLCFSLSELSISCPWYFVPRKKF
jgi:hypothetical protein